MFDTVNDGVSSRQKSNLPAIAHATLNTVSDKFDLIDCHHETALAVQRYYLAYNPQCMVAKLVVIVFAKRTTLLVSFR